MTSPLQGSQGLVAPRFELPATVRDRHVRLFHEYWLSKCVPGRLPGRRDIDPHEMRPFLPHVMMIDVERGPEVKGGGGRYRFRHRLVGTHLVDLFGEDMTGRYIDDMIEPEVYEDVHGRLAQIVDTRRPVYGISPISMPHRDFVEFEHLTAPLASDGATVDILLGVRCGLCPA